MTSCLAHRGPDGEGMQLWGAIGIGHRRLSIIDLDAGRQPLRNEDGQIWVTFNGEIYNFRELRGQLEAFGHRFETHSDTEVIVHAYEQWGDACVERFRGMFAFCVVDLRRRRLFLARDHLGIKPLYLLEQPGLFAFASELQAFHEVPEFDSELDLQAIDQYLRLQYIPAPRCIFRHVRKLPPAHRMSVTFDGHVSEPEEFWRLEFRPDHRRHERDWLESLDAVLRESVKAHLVSDVPFGAFLSGGVDSSAVVAYMAQALDRPVRTFSIGFPDEEFSELAYARQVAERWGTEHHEEVVDVDAMAILPDLVRHYGEPFGDNSAVPTFYVSRLARSSVPMVLSGDGGDEAFAGYHSYRFWTHWLNYGNPRRPSAYLWPTIRDRIIPGRVRTRSVRGVLEPVLDQVLPWRQERRPALENWLQGVTFIPADERAALWRQEFRHLPDLRIESLEREFARTRDYSLVHKAQYLDIKSYLSSDILTKVDIASMMHGLEVRTPLTDVRVYEFAATIPESLNVGLNGGGELEGKLLLKKLMTRYYPAAFLHREKMGFGMPTPRWFALGTRSRQEVRERLLGGGSPLHDLFQPEMLSHQLDNERWGPLWVLLVLDEWMRQRPACALAA